MNTKSKLVLWFTCLVLLSGCGSKTVGFTGPALNAGPVTLSAYINTDGEVTLNGTYSLGAPAKVGPSWDVGFQTTLNQATSKKFTLFILYRDSNGDIIQQECDVNQPFEIDFNNDQWVKKIQHDGNGNIIVSVEPNPLSAAVPAANDAPAASAPIIESAPPITAQVPSNYSNPDETIKRYYQAISDGDYATSWSMLTQSFKNKYNNSGYGPYREWWSTLSRVEILSITDQSVDSQSSYLVVELAYYYKNGQVDTYDQMGFSLIGDNTANDWKINDAVLLKGTR